MPIEQKNFKIYKLLLVFFKILTIYNEKNKMKIQNVKT